MLKIILNHYYLLAFVTICQFDRIVTFTAIADMQQFLKVEEIIIKTLKPYVEQQEINLMILKQHLINLERIKHTWTESPNPINEFITLQQLLQESSALKLLLSQDTSIDIWKKLISPKSRLPFPKYDDLRGAAGGLLRIQKIYDLNVNRIAKGDLENFQMKTEMSAHDCYEMGVASHDNEDFEYSLLWLEEALRRWEETPINDRQPSLNGEILDFMALTYYHQGDFHSAVELTKQLLVLVPHDEIAKQNLAFYKKQSKANDSTTKPATGKKSNLQAYYELLCRQEIKPSARAQAPLRCKYLQRIPFLKIAPIKVEEVSLDPLIVVLYNVITDREIKVLQTNSKPYLERARIINRNGTIHYSQIRTGQSAWIFDDSPPEIQTLDRRIEQITGLTTSTAEPIQVVNYGVGGHYDVHFDYVGKDDTTSFPKIGNRLATILFYLTDVAQGGATVFPALDLAVFPHKGAALLWYNLDTAGDPDSMTMHGACPVIQGDKWVCNKWLHEKGQELLRPCEFILIDDSEK